MPYVTSAEMLMTSIVKGQLQLVKILLSGGTDVNSCLLDGRTALMICCSIHKADRSKNYEAKLIKILEVLLKYGANVNMVDRKNRSCLMYACSNGYSLEFIEMLLNHGADTTQKDSAGLNCVEYARQECHNYIAKYLQIRTGKTHDVPDLQFQENIGSNENKTIFPFSRTIKYLKDRSLATRAHLKYKMPDVDGQSLSDDNRSLCIPSDPPTSPSNVSFVFEPQFVFEKKFDTIKEIGDIHEKESNVLSNTKSVPATEKENAPPNADSTKEEVKSQNVFIYPTPPQISTTENNNATHIYREKELSSNEKEQKFWNFLNKNNQSGRTTENFNSMKLLNRRKIVTNNRLSRPFGFKHSTTIYDSTNYPVECRTVFYKDAKIQNGKENTVFPNKNRADILTEIGIHRNSGDIILYSEDDHSEVNPRRSQQNKRFDHQEPACKKQEKTVIASSEHKDDYKLENGQKISQRVNKSNGNKETTNKQSNSRKHLPFLVHANQNLEVPEVSEQYWKQRYSSHSIYDADNYHGDPNKRRGTYPTLSTYNKNVPKRSTQVIKLPPI